MCESVKIYKENVVRRIKFFGHSVFRGMKEKMEVTYNNFLQSFLKKSSIAICDASDMLDSIDFQSHDNLDNNNIPPFNNYSTS